MMWAYVAVALMAALLGRSARSQCIVTAAGAVNIEGGMATALVLSLPQAAPPDPSGTFVLIAEADNHVIRRVQLSNGTLSTVVGQFRRPGYGGNGGPATSALLDYVTCLLPDGSGGYLFCDFNNNAIRRLLANGTVVAAFGVGNVPGYSGDGGPASLARMDGPTSMSSDGFGGFLIADSLSNVVRRVSSTVGGGFTDSVSHRVGL